MSVGKYYVVDSGYASQSGFLTPFRGERYHLPDYKGFRRSPRTTKELFNYRHSSLQNVIERTFGVLKNKFQILRLMHQFPVETQASIVLACCGLHNYIREEHIADAEFVGMSDDLKVAEDDLNPPHEDFVDHSTIQSSQRNQAKEMNATRLRIINAMARQQRMPEIVEN